MKKPKEKKACAWRKKRLAREWLLPIFWLYIFWSECVVRATTNRPFWANGLMVTALFSLVAALIVYGLCSVFPKRVNRVIEHICVFGLLLFYISQTIYYYKFHCFYNFYSMGNGGQIVEFWRIILKALWVKAVPLLLLLLPAIALTVFGCVFEEPKLRHWYCRLSALVLAVCLHFGVIALLPLFGMESSVSAYHVYYDTNDLQQGAYHIGLLPSFRLDIHRWLFGFDGGRLSELERPEEPEATEAATENTEGVPAEPETTQPEPIIDTSPNVLDIDFAARAQEETDETLAMLDQYFSERTPTNKNEKTGMFAGCNLIQITAEGFSYLAIDPELTPTLYKLQTQGFNFTNFYTAYWGVSTSDGEYVALTGTIPKSGTWSMSDTQDNAMPLTMAQQLKHLGYSAQAYHDHTATYYHRDKSHPNLGYVFKALGRGLEVEEQWPESDVEMIDLTTEDYVNQEPFHTYYMTVSGHLEYNFDGNCIAAKNRELVEELPYSEAVQAYLACQIELDRALELLLQRLEEAGVLENTVIVLTADHYPYGLTNEQISELAGHEIDPRFELYRNACIIYKEGMTPETVDWPCSSLDLLPTLSNLFGLEFDSRLYMGHDVFSEAEPLIIFSDRSWLTEKGSFYSSDETVTSFTEQPLSKDMVRYYNQKVADKFLVSQWILEKDYWRTIFGDNLPPDE